MGLRPTRSQIWSPFSDSFWAQWQSHFQPHKAHWLAILKATLQGLSKPMHGPNISVAFLFVLVFLPHMQNHVTRAISSFSSSRVGLDCMNLRPFIHVSLKLQLWQRRYPRCLPPEAFLLHVNLPRLHGNRLCRPDSDLAHQFNQFVP